MTRSTEQLGIQIERLVEEHVAASHRAAAAAVERAFASERRGRSKRSHDATKGSTANRRRSPAEIVTLGERLYKAVCANPGEGMKVLAAEVGESARELHRPMALLKRAGRVRSAGQRQFTRYFPIATGISESA